MTSDTRNTAEQQSASTWGGLRAQPFGVAMRAWLYFDTRWIGDHGIGRFAREVQARCPELIDAGLAGRPSAPTDCLRTAFWLLRRPRAILFSPGYNAPLFCQRRTILTVHDLNHIDAPTSSSGAKRLFYRLILRRACRRAPLVFTVSDYSRARIIEWSGADPTRVINVGNGVSPVFAEAGPTASQTSGPFFLCVSNRKPHKNEARMLEAFRSADLAEDAQLLISGEASEDQRRWLDEQGLATRVRFLGQLSDEALASYYRAARGLVFVSTYEGFGLPAAEAMACGTPLLVASVTSLPEVVGDAGLTCDPLDVDSIRVGMERLWNDQALRETLRAKGLERARRFDWQQVAERIRTAIGYH